MDNAMDRNGEENTNPEAQTASAMVKTESETKANEKVTGEKFKISRDVGVGKIKEHIQQGNIGRLILKNESGQTLIEMQRLKASPLEGRRIVLLTYPLRIQASTS